MQKFIEGEAYMSRTSAGYTHGNRLVVRKLKTVVVFLDIPHLPSDLHDSYRLVSQTGEYNRTLPRSEAVKQDEKRMLLLFTEVPPSGTYSLYQAVTPEIEIPVFLDVPFADLPDYGVEGSAPDMTEPKKLALKPPPRLKSEDPLVHADDADCKLDSKRYLDLLAYRNQRSEDGSALA